MKLTELCPKLYKEGDFLKGNRLEEADQLIFDCPQCNGSHIVGVYFSPPFERGWNRTGTTLDNLTVTPSIQVIGKCGWHGFITNGEIITV